MATSSSGSSSAETASQEQEEKQSDFDKAIAKSDSLGGLFTVYRDTTDGSMKIALDTSQIGEDYIYHTQAVNGPVALGLNRGTYRDNAVFTIRRHYDKIEFVEVNTNFHFNDESALAKASEANISPSVLHVEKVVAEQDGQVLIEADNLFLTEALHQVKPSPYPGQPPTAFKLGRQSSSKSKIESVHNYPENTDVVVDYVFENPRPINGGGDAITDARNVTATLRHSLIKVPENDYEPRFADPRIGYFTTQKDDQTSTSSTPYHDLINRWHLKKKNPDAEMSEPVEPITWWIENTTPERIRPIIRRAVLQWNEAFEAAGFRNAVEVKVQPDTASWDAGDIRYNVLRWTSSPESRFSGYGPSFVNPHTGQILGADIMLEYSHLTNEVRYNKLFDASSQSLQDVLFGDAKGSSLAKNLAKRAAGTADPTRTCTLGALMQANMVFGQAVGEVLGRSGATAPDPDNTQNGPSDLDGEITPLLEQSLYFLALHEVGHTLGLMHNMKASQLHDAEEVHNAALTEEEGLVGSVMDYPAINVAPPETEQGQYYTTTPGPYDKWAIQYGYANASESELDQILSRSTEPELAFGNDADDMRAPGKAIDPRVMVYDMSGEALDYAEDRMNLVQELGGDLLEKYEEPGQSYQELRDAFFVSVGQHGRMASVVSRYVGGVYVDRGFIGQEGATEPYRPVALEDQRRALELLEEYVFAPDAFDFIPSELYQHLQPQRRGFNFYYNSEDPKIHARVRGIHESVLAHLLHPNVLERMTDTRLYGNEYSLAAYMEDLTDDVFAADADGNVNTFRQNLQVAYTEALVGVVGEAGNQQYDYVAQSAALQSLRQIQDLIEDKRGVNAETRAHTEHVLLLIEKALDT
jgi:hypothetical protein